MGLTRRHRDKFVTTVFYTQQVPRAALVRGASADTTAAAFPGTATGSTVTPAAVAAGGGGATAAADGVVAAGSLVTHAGPLAATAPARAP